MIKSIAKGIALLDATVVALGRRFDAPVIVEKNRTALLRHRSHDALLASFLLCARLTSNLNACRSLLRRGFVQEVAGLCRAVNEAVDDIFFLTIEDGEATIVEDRKRYCEEFFDEGFDGSQASSVVRNQVWRQKFGAALTEWEIEQLNGPTGSPGVLGVIHKLYSEIRRGKYSQVMDAYGGSPCRYQTRGLLKMPWPMEECQIRLAHATFRGIIAGRIVARTAGAEQLAELLRGEAQKLADELELGAKPIRVVLARVKAQQAV